MTIFFASMFKRYPTKMHRLLEILPGFISWTLILSPIWASLLFPYILAYFILFFDVFWLYKSVSLTITAYLASKKIRAAERMNWLEKAEQMTHFSKMTHVLIITNYQESTAKLRDTLTSLATQTFPTKQIYVVLAMEQREKAAAERGTILTHEFKHIFGDIFATFHPDIEGEVKGKSSNQSYAAKQAYKKLIETGKIDINYATISSVDADSIFDKQFCAYLAYKFLTDPQPYNKFWQSANVNYNNFWTVPAPIRVTSFFSSLSRTAQLIQGESLMINSTYTLSFKMLKDIGYWDTDVIPEDYRILFKAFYKLKGNVWTVPIFLKTSMDAPLSSSYMKSLKNKYHQERRWSWGVSDDAVFIKWWLTIPGVPFFRKTMMLLNVLYDHFLWPVNWFIITIAANIIPLVNPVFSRTTLGYNLPKLAGFILTFCIFSLLAMIIIDFRNRPKHMKNTTARQFLFPLEFVLLPIVGFFLSALPAIISHTQLMLGKRLEYKVTEKL